MHNYDAYKMRLFCFTAGIIAAGFTVEFTLGDIEQAVKAFASGGVITEALRQCSSKFIDQFFSAVDDEEETKKKNESEGKEGEAQKFSLESPFERLQKIADIIIIGSTLRAEWPSWRTLDVSLRNISAPTTALDDRLWLLFV